MTLLDAQPKEHLSFPKHLTGEVKTEEFVSGKRQVTKWERHERSNQSFAALSKARADGHLCGVRLLDSEPSPPPQEYGELSYRAGGPEWIDMHRWM